MVSRAQLRMFAVVVAACCVQARPLQAQVVTGQITSGETNAPLRGAFVRLFDASGEQRKAVLTDQLGRYRILAPEAGEYSLRVELIGHRSVEYGPVGVGVTEPLQWSPSLSPQAIVLGGLEVAVRERCVIRPEEGSVVAALWQEAQKALTVAAWAARQGRFRYQLLSQERELAMDGVSIVAEESGLSEGYYRQPFVSKPVAELLERGFVQEVDGGTFAYAPDAEVLLSKEFVDEYCFRLSTDGDTRVGISFEPTQERRVTDIKGTMWLNRATSRLETVEFDYIRFPGVRSTGDLGGSVDFQQLPSGAWIVRRWAITMPIISDVESPRATGGWEWNLRQTGFHVAGAEVLRAITQDGVAVLVAERAALSGAVFDSIRHGPLIGATVRLEGTDYEAITGEDGSFHIAGLPQGRYSVQVEHPRLDSLQLDATRTAIDLVIGDTTVVTLGIPTDAPLREGEDWVVQGELRDSSNRRPVVGALVSLVDEDGRLSGTDMSDEHGDYRVPVRTAGSYRLKFDVLGRTSVLSESFEVTRGNRKLRNVPFDGSPWELPAGDPSTESRCIRAPRHDSPTGTAWAEVQKALANLLWVRDSERVEYAITQYRKHRGEDRIRRVIRSEQDRVSGYVNHSFEPTQLIDLDKEGFAQASRDSVVTITPDPRILASEWLAEHSCVRLVTDVSGATRVGVEVRQDEAAPLTGIRGLFVLSRTTGQLESFHYRYTDFPGVRTVETPGGWMTFDRLPQGGVFLSEWESRLPQGAKMQRMGLPNLPATAYGAVWVINEGGYVRQARDVGERELWSRSAVDSMPTHHSDSLWAIGSEVFGGGDVERMAAFQSSDAGPADMVVTADGSRRGEYAVQVIGTVEARESGDPLPNVSLRIADLPAIATDANGRFRVTTLPPGSYPIQVEFLGREPVLDTLVLGDAEIASVTITLAEAPIELDELVVEVEPRSFILQESGFYDRRDKSGISGTQITRFDIEQRLGSPEISDLLTNVPGTHIQSGVYPVGASTMRVHRSGNVFGFMQRAENWCEPSVYVDGLIYVDDPFPTGNGTKVTDLNFLPADVIEGIEVFTGLTTPAQFDANSCGVILIWTRGYR